MPKNKLTQVIEELANQPRNKPGTERLLDHTRKINSDIKRSNIAAGASYGPGTPYHTHDWQRSELGAGAKHFGNKAQRETIPTSATEHRGFKVTPMNKEPWHWHIEAIGFPTPKELDCSWTRYEAAEKAIDDYWRKEETRKNEVVLVGAS